jgi:hypothetical protein
MQIQTQEPRITLAIEAIRSSRKPSRRAAAKLYNVPETTLRARITGRPSRVETRPKVQLLTDLEKVVIVRHILDIDERGFAPRLAGVEKMANC